MIFVVFTGVYLLALAVEDMIRHDVSAFELIAGAAVITISFFTGMCPEGIPPSVPMRLAGLLPGVCMLACTLLTKGKIGAADGILCITLGFSMGISLICSVLALSLLLVAFYSIALLARGRWKRNRQIAFIPFLFMGFVLVWITA